MVFTCDSLFVARMKCGSCGVFVDLRDMAVLPDDTLNPLSEQEKEPVSYAADVELQVGCSTGSAATDKVRSVLKETRKETMILATSVDAADVARDHQDLRDAKKLWFLHVIVHTLEFILFGRHPYCTLGHIRVFRKRIPFLGYKFIPVPRTSVRSSLLMLVIFVLTCCSYYAVHQCRHHYWLWPLLYLLLVMVMICYTNIVLLVYSDPGFVLPSYISGDTEGGNEIINRDAAYEYVRNQSAKAEGKAIEEESVNGSSHRESKWVLVDDVAMERKWCTQCRMYRPLRTAHCYQCGLCVYIHDHHCGVTGACVGHRNNVHFVLFLTEGFMAAFLSGLITFLCLWYEPYSFSWTAIGLLSVFGVLLSAPVTVLTTSLARVGWYGIVCEITTRERLQKVYASKRNPFRKPWKQNIKYQFCQKRKNPSIFREEVMSLWASASNYQDKKSSKSGVDLP